MLASNGSIIVKKLVWKQARHPIKFPIEADESAKTGWHPPHCVCRLTLQER